MRTRLTALLLCMLFVVGCDARIDPPPESKAPMTERVEPTPSIESRVSPSATVKPPAAPPDLEMTVSIHPDLPDVTIASNGRQGKWDYFIWQNGEFAYDPYGLDNISNPHFDSEHHVIIEEVLYGWWNYFKSEHAYTDDGLMRMSSEEWVSEYMSPDEIEQIAVLLPELEAFPNWSVYAHETKEKNDILLDYVFLSDLQGGGEDFITNELFAYPIDSDIGKALTEILDWEWTSQY